MKKFILMLFAVFMMFSSMAQAYHVSAWYVESHAVASDITPGLNIAIAGNIGMERTYFGEEYTYKSLGDKPEGAMLVGSIGGGSSNGASGGGTIGAIRS